MSSALDQSLDSLIKSKRTSRRNSRPQKLAEKKKTSSISKGKKAATTGKAKPTAAPALAAATAPTSSKIIISNLPPDVKEQEFRDLFQKTIGPLREATLHFDSKGQSKGSGSVVFVRKEDAPKAVKMYHNRLIDGHRQMKVEMVLQAGQAVTPPTLTQRVAAGPAVVVANARKGAVKAIQKKKQALRQRKPKVKRTPTTAADLDAQMEDYSAAASAGPAAA